MKRQCFDFGLHHHRYVASRSLMLNLLQLLREPPAAVTVGHCHQRDGQDSLSPWKVEASCRTLTPGEDLIHDSWHSLRRKRRRFVKVTLLIHCV